MLYVHICIYGICAIYIYIYIYMYVYMCVFVCVCVCVHMCIYISIYTIEAQVCADEPQVSSDEFSLGG